jgi:uncharacterized protein DUF4124
LVAIFAGRIPVDAAVIYKWTDADGVIHFSDQPVPGAEKIQTSSGASGPSGAAPAASSTAPSSTDKPKPPALNFREFSIVSPANQETITGNQPINVNLALEPQLNSNQSLTWTLDGGALSDQANATSFTLEDVPRGTHTIIATVEDQSGQSKSSEPVTFYVMRTNLLSPQRKAAP